MKKLRYIIVLVFACVICASAYAKPKISIKQIPLHADAEVKTQIRRLYSWSYAKRYDACKKLGEMGEKAIPAIPFLIEELQDYSNWSILNKRPPRYAAREALIRIGKPAVPALLDTLKHKDKFVRREAVEALGDIKDPRVIQPLIHMLEDQEKTVRKATAWALSGLAGWRNSKLEYYYKDTYGEDKLKWQTWWDRNKEPFAK